MRIYKCHRNADKQLSATWHRCVIWCISFSFPLPKTRTLPEFTTRNSQFQVGNIQVRSTNHCRIACSYFVGGKNNTECYPLSLFLSVFSFILVYQKVWHLFSAAVLHSGESLLQENNNFRAPSSSEWFWQAEMWREERTTKIRLRIICVYAGAMPPF